MTTFADALETLAEQNDAFQEIHCICVYEKQNPKSELYNKDMLTYRSEVRKILKKQSKKDYNYTRALTFLMDKELTPWSKYVSFYEFVYGKNPPCKSGLNEVMSELVNEIKLEMLGDPAYRKSKGCFP